MSYLECNPNHCESVKAMGKSLVEQELKIKKLEQQKAELVECLKYVQDKADFEIYNHITSVFNKLQNSL